MKQHTKNKINKKLSWKIQVILGLVFFCVIQMAVSQQTASSTRLDAPAEVAPFLVPAGAVIPFAGDTTSIPPGWLLCDGTSLSREMYPDLFIAIGTYWGTGERGNDSFRLPDLRGLFLRGVNGTAFNSATGNLVDPDANQRGNHPLYSELRDGESNDVGSYQQDSLQQHTHQYTAGIDDGSHDHDTTGQNNIEVLAGQRTAPSDDARTSQETRPVNAYVNYIIKY